MNNRAIGLLILEFSLLPSLQAATVLLNPADDIQAKVDAHPAGTIYQFSAGIFRLQTVIPKTGDSFIGDLGSGGERRTILSGARHLVNFTSEGPYWVASLQTQEGARSGPTDSTPACEAASPRCTYPEDLYFDHRPLQSVGDLSQVGPGQWFFDYAADKIYFADDPQGHTVEIGVLPVAFDARSGQTQVTLRNLIVEKYAAPAQRGAIESNGGTGWVIEGNEIRLNHGRGISLCCGENSQIVKNKITQNGQLGLGTYDTDHLLIADNEFSYNNYAGYNVWWEAGGTKFTSSRDLIVRNNDSHHNLAEGLWTDGNNLNTLYENNRVFDNLNHGIHHEISYSAIFRGNRIERNGLPGLLITNSPDVEVYDNILLGNDRGGLQLLARQIDAPAMGDYGLHVLSNLYVHHNISEGTAGLKTAGTAANDDSFFATRQNRWVGNAYYLPGLNAAFSWRNQNLSVSEWREFGNDVNGSFANVAYNGVSPTMLESNVRVYPNPWRRDRHASADIIFDGLTPGSSIKIFSVAGHWIKTLYASGNREGWNLTNSSGNPVASGLYLYLITLHDTQTRGKLVIVR